MREVRQSSFSSFTKLVDLTNSTHGVFQNPNYELWTSIMKRDKVLLFLNKLNLFWYLSNEPFDKEFSTSIKKVLWPARKEGHGVFFFPTCKMRVLL